jgi:hypothetical protein
VKSPVQVVGTDVDQSRRQMNPWPGSCFLSLHRFVRWHKGASSSIAPVGISASTASTYTIYVVLRRSSGAIRFHLLTSAPTSQYWCLHVQHTVIQYYSKTVTYWEHPDWYGLTSKEWNVIGSIINVLSRRNREYRPKRNPLEISLSFDSEPVLSQSERKS